MNDTQKELTVLLVEDNPGDVRLVEELLKDGMEKPFRLEHSHNLSGAMGKVAEYDVDIILLDLSLPDSTGFTTFAKCHESAPDVATVVLTGTNDQDLAVRALREGAQDYLIKGTVDSVMLSRSMRYAVERKRAEDEIRRMAMERETLAEIGRIVSSSPKVADIYEAFADQVRKLVPFDRIVISTLDWETETVMPKYYSGIQVEHWDQRIPFNVGGTLVQRAVESRTAASTSGEHHGYFGHDDQLGHPCKEAGLRAALAAPLIAGDGVVGLLTLHSKDELAYSEFDLQLVEQIAAQIAGALAQAQLVEELQDAASKIKTLSGLIPICASCKKIRDDSGYWSQIETYLREHSDAVFSHGLCPACVRTIYPEL